MLARSGRACPRPAQLQPGLKKAEAASGGEDNGVCPLATWPSAYQGGVW